MSRADQTLAEAARRLAGRHRTLSEAILRAGRDRYTRDVLVARRDELELLLPHLPVELLPPDLRDIRPEIIARGAA